MAPLGSSLKIGDVILLFYEKSSERHAADKQTTADKPAAEDSAEKSGYILADLSGYEPTQLALFARQTDHANLLVCLGLDLISC